MFGARIYDLQVKRGQGGRKPLDYPDPLDDGTAARSHIVGAATRLGERGAIAKVPMSRQLAEFDPSLAPTSGDPLTTFVTPTATASVGAMPDAEPWTFGAAGTSHVFLKVEFGYVGAYENARDIATSIPIRERAATGVFRALFLLPPTGTHGRLCLETNGRVSPLVPMLGLLAWEGYKDAVDRLGSVRNEPWIRFRAEQMADLARLRKLANEMERVDVELSRKQPSKAGGNVGRSVTLTVSVTEKERRKEAVSQLLGWVNGGDPGEYVHVLEKIAGYDPEALDEVGLTFNSGTLDVTDAKGQKKKFDPEHIRARFTYHLSETQLDDAAWLAKVKGIVTGDLLAGTEIQW